MILLIIILTKRYGTLRSDIEFIIKKFNDSNSDKADHPFLSNYNTEKTLPVSNNEFLDQLHKLLGPEYLIKLGSSSGLLTIKIYPKAANEDSGCMFYIDMETFDYTDNLSRITEALKKCNYIK